MTFDLQGGDRLCTCVVMSVAIYERQESASGEEPPLYTLPHEVVLGVFEYVPSKEIVNTCKLICKGWKLFFDDPRFWQLRMARSGNYDHRLADIPGLNWAQLCIKTTNDPNLIKNVGNDGELSLKPWTISYDSWDRFSQNLSGTSTPDPSGWNYGGGDQWNIEKCVPAENAQLIVENGGSLKNYVTSYEWCCREQILDLDTLGFAPAVLDNLQPAIEVSEWFCARNDCGSIFNIRVDLLDEKKSSLAKFECSEQTSQWQGGALGWRKVEHIFRNYGAGVRYIRFADAGKDTQWWAGHYGSKMAAAWVRVWFSGK